MEEDTDLYVSDYDATPEPARLRQAKDYKRNEGFLLVNDVGHKAMAALALAEVDMLQRLPFGESRETIPLPPSVASLALVSRHFQLSLPPYVTNSYAVGRHFGVDARERDKAKSEFVFNGGLDDMGFTWHFAPVVATEIAHAFVSQKLLSSEQMNRLTLADWADMIGSYWFSDVIHDLVLTRNGMYGSAGNHVEDYDRDNDKSLVNVVYRRIASLDPEYRDILKSSGLFVVGTIKEESSGITYLTAKVHPAARRILREQMRRSPESVGCPVARRAGALVVEDIEANKHFRNLVTRGEFEVTGQAEGKVRFRQEYTPIDRGLDGLAKQLESYDEKYGNPRYSGRGVSIVHVRLPKTGVLSFPG